MAIKRISTDLRKETLKALRSRENIFSTLEQNLENEGIEYSDKELAQTLEHLCDEGKIMFRKLSIIGTKDKATERRLVIEIIVRKEED
jgi:hypothetical protein